jgi:hypothetical protein
MLLNNSVSVHNSDLVGLTDPDDQAPITRRAYFPRNLTSLAENLQSNVRCSPFRCQCPQRQGSFALGFGTFLRMRRLGIGL